MSGSLIERLRASGRKLSQFAAEVEMGLPEPNLFHEAAAAIHHMAELLETAVDAHDSGGLVMDAWYREAEASVEAARAVGGEE